MNELNLISFRWPVTKANLFLKNMFANYSRTKRWTNWRKRGSRKSPGRRGWGQKAPLGEQVLDEARDGRHRSSIEKSSEKKPFNGPSVNKPTRVKSSILPGKKVDITDLQSTYCWFVVYINLITWTMLCHGFELDCFKTMHIKSSLSVGPC